MEELEGWCLIQRTESNQGGANDVSLENPVVDFDLFASGLEEDCEESSGTKKHSDCKNVEIATEAQKPSCTNMKEAETESDEEYDFLFDCSLEEKSFKNGQEEKQSRFSDSALNCAAVDTLPVYSECQDIMNFFSEEHESRMKDNDYFCIVPLFDQYEMHASLLNSDSEEISQEDNNTLSQAEKQSEIKKETSLEIDDIKLVNDSPVSIHEDSSKPNNVTKSKCVKEAHLERSPLPPRKKRRRKQNIFNDVPTNYTANEVTRGDLDNVYIKEDFHLPLLNKYQILENEGET